MFESFVNSEECKTSIARIHPNRLFESFVNSEECKTLIFCVMFLLRLRALLIQKSVKLLSQWVSLSLV